MCGGTNLKVFIKTGGVAPRVVCGSPGPHIAVKSQTYGISELQAPHTTHVKYLCSTSDESES